MRLCLGGRCYTAEKLEKDYLAEVANYSNDRWEAPQRAARLAASVKRYKTSEMLRFIFATIAYDPDPDLTPLTVRRLCKALFRSESTRLNSSHVSISYAVFCLKKKNTNNQAHALYRRATEYQEQ